MLVLRKLIPLLLILPTLAWGQSIDQKRVGFYLANKAGSNCSQDTLILADAAASAAGQILVIPPVDRFGVACQWVITADMTITAPVFFSYALTPVLKVNGGITLTLAECPVVWGAYYIIDANEVTTGVVDYAGSCGQCAIAGDDDWIRCQASGSSAISEDLSDNPIADLENVNADANAADNETLVGDGTEYRGVGLPVSCNPATDKTHYNSATRTWTCETDISGGTATLDTAFDNGKTIDGANSQANATQIGNGTVYWQFYCDSNDECFQRTSTPSDTNVTAATDKNIVLYDAESDGPILTIDPDAASSNAAFQFGAGFNLLTSAEVVLRPGGDCTVAEESIVTNDPIDEWISCADATGDYVAFNFWITAKTATATGINIIMHAVNKNVTPGGTYTLNCAAQAVRPGIDVYAAHDTTGEQPVSFTTFDTQSVPEAASAAVTINGTVADGAHIKGQCNVAAAPAQIADIRLSGVAVIQILTNSITD